MGNKVVSNREINEKTHITEIQGAGFWLWDENRGMNLAMREPDETSALIRALEYYQRRLLEVEEDHNHLRTCVEKFFDDLHPDRDEDNCTF